MSVYHCPLCPLTFQFRTEVEGHLRNEHRSRADENGDLRVELAAADTLLDWDGLRALQSSYARPSVSLLMATTPAPTMSSLDGARLQDLAHIARRRLAAEPGAGADSDVEHRLARAVAAAEDHPTDRGLVVLVSAHQTAIFALPFAPRDRAVIDPRFATRDLEFALQNHPRYRLVVLGGSPRVLEGRGHHLAETATSAEGPGLFGRNRGGGGRRSSRPKHWLARRARLEAGCDQADRLLDQRVQTAGAMPLVVVGDDRWRHEFRRRSRHAASIVAEIPGSQARKAAATLAELAQPGLEAWRHSQQAARITELHQADRDGTLTWGLANTWTAVRDGVADGVWVEHGYAQPGSRIPGVVGLETSNDPAQPGVSDDLVDDLTQMAAAQGIPVDLVDDGRLGRPEPIAARVPAARHPGADPAPHDTQEPDQPDNLARTTPGSGPGHRDHHPSS